MSKKNNIEDIKHLFDIENAVLDLNSVYKDRHSTLNYTCRYGEQHTTSLSNWSRGRRCVCFKKWENRLSIFNTTKAIIEKYNGKILYSLEDCLTTTTSLYFINSSGSKVKISLNNMLLCEKIQHLKEEIIVYYNSGKKLIEVIDHFGYSIIPMALRLWGYNNSDSNRFIKKIYIPKEDLYNMYWEEKKHPVYIAKKYNCSITAVVNCMKEANIPFRTKSEARMGELNPIYNVGHSEEARGKMSQAFVNGREIGYHSSWGKTSKYNTPTQGLVTMRSSWEVRVADYLTSIDKQWLYEPFTFKLTDTISYRPDFYIPEDDVYIEVKGWLREEDQYKIDLFKKLDFKLYIWDRILLESKGLINASGKIIYNA